jgi:hypothetical protein
MKNFNIFHKNNNHLFLIDKCFWFYGGQQISIDIVVGKNQNFQNFEFQGCYTPEMKAENMCNSN